MVTKGVINKLLVLDFDGTLINSPIPEDGMALYKERTGKDFPDKGWWSSPASLDTNVFDIKPYNNVLSILIKECQNPHTTVIILTSRVKELRPEIENVLNKNNIKVDDIIMNDYNVGKGEKIFDLIRWNRDVKQIDVYDDRDVDINSYLLIKNEIPEDIVFNIYRANKGNVFLIKEAVNMAKIIEEELDKFSDELERRNKDIID